MKKRKKILLVDDDIDILEQTGAVLKTAGYDTMTAAGENEAMKILEEVKPDLAVIDLMMEKTDSGFILSRKIKSIDPSIPVIIVTGVTKETGIHFEIQKSGGSGWIKADAILNKDIRYEQLLSKISDLIK